MVTRNGGIANDATGGTRTSEFDASRGREHQTWRGGSSPGVSRNREALASPTGDACDSALERSHLWKVRNQRT